jgi:hypothetical protein
MSENEQIIRRVLLTEFGLTPEGYELRWIFWDAKVGPRNTWVFQLRGVSPPTKAIYGSTTRSIIRAIRRRFTPSVLPERPTLPEVYAITKRTTVYA